MLPNESAAKRGFDSEAWNDCACGKQGGKHSSQPFCVVYITDPPADVLAGHACMATASQTSLKSFMCTVSIIPMWWIVALA